MWLPKPDYTAEVRRPTRRIAIALLMAATLTSALCFALSIAIVVVIAVTGVEGPPAPAIGGCLLIFGAMTGACGWILIRLLRNARASNGRTTMPIWFIQAFGVVFLVALCGLALVEMRPFLFGEAIGVAIAMIGIPILLRMPRRDHNEEE